MTLAVDIPEQECLNMILVLFFSLEDNPFSQAWRYPVILILGRYEHTTCSHLAYFSNTDNLLFFVHLYKLVEQ